MADEITKNCPLCEGEGYIDKGDMSNGSYLEAYVVCCDCNLPYKTRGYDFRKALAEALEAGRMDVIRALCQEDLDTDEIVMNWDEWKAENLAVQQES